VLAWLAIVLCLLAIVLVLVPAMIA